MVAIGVMISYFINRLVHVLPYYMYRAHTMLKQLASAFTWRKARTSGKFLLDSNLSQLL